MLAEDTVIVSKEVSEDEVVALIADELWIYVSGTLQACVSDKRRRRIIMLLQARLQQVARE